MTRYKCYFRHPTSNDGIVSRELILAVVDDNPCVDGQKLQQAFRDGFWINDKGILADWKTGKYWIPPAAIIMLEKYDEPEDDDQA